jgi:hypothetical protein
MGSAAVGAGCPIVFAPSATIVAAISGEDAVIKLIPPKAKEGQLHNTTATTLTIMATFFFIRSSP